jgi:glucokinase
MDKAAAQSTVAVTGATAEGKRPSTQPLDWSGVLAQQGYVFGVDISAESQRVALADVHGSIVGSATNGAGALTLDPAVVAEHVSGMMRDLLEKGGIKPREVLRVGVGFGGPVDAARGLVRRSHDAAVWNDYPLAAEIEQRIDTPTFLENDARLAALGEVWFGAGRDTTECDLVYIHWSTGVGGGIVTSGRLLSGSTTIAGEIGHTAVRTREGALPCRCGSKGHLEAYVRGPALIERTRAMGGGRDPRSVADVFALASTDAEVQALVGEAVQLMGVTAANLITAINPNILVIGGRVAREAAHLIPGIAEIAREYAMPVSLQGVEIVPTTLGDEATLMGALALALGTLR